MQSTARRVAPGHARGLRHCLLKAIGIGETRRFEGVLGTCFEGQVIEAHNHQGKHFVTPRVRGRAHIAGFHQFVLAAQDPSPRVSNGSVAAKVAPTHSIRITGIQRPAGLQHHNSDEANDCDFRRFYKFKIRVLNEHGSWRWLRSLVRSWVAPQLIQLHRRTQRLVNTIQLFLRGRRCRH